MHTYSHQGQALMGIIIMMPLLLRMSTLSQEMSALNPVRIDVMRISCMTCATGVCVQSHATTFRDLSCLKEIV